MQVSKVNMAHILEHLTAIAKMWASLMGLMAFPICILHFFFSLLFSWFLNLTKCITSAGSPQMQFLEYCDLKQRRRGVLEKWAENM